MKVLVVEDNRKLASFLVRALTEEGYTADVVDDGGVARDQIRGMPYDLVILDWMLPTLDGLAVCRATRAVGISVPILMLTARSDVPERITGLDAGADDYLAKPFDLGELMARVRALARRGAGERMLVVGPLRIDRHERTTMLDGQRLDLTPREFSLLTHLLGRAGTVVTRSELLAKVWDTTFDPGSNLVEVHVKNLRSKLGAHAAALETVRGVGYRWRIETCD
jgi:two-component system, OmpR family, response regulator